MKCDEEGVVLIPNSLLVSRLAVVALLKIAAITRANVSIG